MPPAFPNLAKLQESMQLRSGAGGAKPDAKKARRAVEDLIRAHSSDDGSLPLFDSREDLERMLSDAKLFVGVLRAAGMTA